MLLLLFSFLAHTKHKHCQHNGSGCTSFTPGYTLHPSHSGGHVEWASTEPASALFVAIYVMAAQMVWYGTAVFHIYLAYQLAHHDLPSLLVSNLSITTDKNFHVLIDTIPLSLPRTSPLSSTIYLCCIEQLSQPAFIPFGGPAELNNSFQIWQERRGLVNQAQSG